jgi:hypothetical protein
LPGFAQKALGRIAAKRKEFEEFEDRSQNPVVRLSLSRRFVPIRRSTQRLLAPGFWLLPPILELLPPFIIPAMQGPWLYPKIEQTY